MKQRIFFRYWLFVLAIGMSLPVHFVSPKAFATPLSARSRVPKRIGALKGRWFFDHAHPQGAVCAPIDGLFLKRYGRSGISCSYSETGGYSETAKGEVYVCDGAQTSWMVAETARACREHLEAELLNGV